MSLVVQVAGGPSGSAPPPAPPKGVVITATARGPPPAHSATPFSFHDQHVVQHHPQPAGPPGTPPGYSRPLPMSPASGARPLPMSPSRGHGARTRITDPGTGHRLVVQHHQLPTQPLPLLSPGPAHAHTILGVNSPSLIPTSFMPRLPIHLTQGPGQPPGVRLSPAPGLAHHRSPLHVSGHQLSSAPAAPDTKILPPHAIRRLTRPAPNILHPDDDIEVGDSPAHPHPHHPRHRSLMSPKHNRKSLFTNLALQDHNYCAAPPPSPPRSPTPPVSPYTSAPGPHMGVALQAHGKDHGLAPGLEPANPSAGPGSLVPLSAGSLAPSVSPHPSVGGYPSPHYIGAPLASPRNRLKESLDAAGVGPMTPLGDNDSLKDRSVSDTMEDGGEETETAPEAEDEGQDDSVTRCICDFTHDDGYMICCDKCSVWQHVNCMGLDKNNIPDEYLCEKCSPRPVDRKRAKALQKAIAKEQKERFAKLRQTGQAQDSSDDEKNKSGLAGLDKSRKPFTTPGRKFGGKKALEKKLLEGKKLIKKTHKRRTHRDSGVRVNTESSSPGSPAKRTQVKDGSPRKSLPRRSLSGSDGETEAEAEESGPGETLSLRSWIDNYEEAVTNHYSPELRARLTGAKLPSNFFKPKDVSGIRCNVSLRGNGLKVLTANSYIPSDTAVIECRGKYMLNNPGLNKASRSNPYVLQHRLGSDLEVLVDGTTYGNDSRFCRRASPSTGESNAVIRHHLEKGSLHLYIVASRNIEKNSEILLPPLERKNGHIEEEMSIADELREIKKASAAKHVNGNAEGGRRKLLNKKRVAKRDVSKKKDDVSSSDEDDDVRAEREARIAKEKERLARQREQREREREERTDKTSPRKTRSAVNSVVTDIKEEETEAEVKEEPRDSVKEEEQQQQQLSIMIPKDKEDSGSVKNSPSIMSPALSGKSPTKPSLGLPDQSGLIVGVNTINYDVSFRNKTKTREERKMEMIMKAFEDMEKKQNEGRKRNESETTSSVPKPEKKRRRSNSIKAGGNSGAGDSNLDQSSADEAYVGVTAALNAAKKKGRSSAKRPSGSAGSVPSSRRRSRAKSGDSSAMSEQEQAEEMAEKFKFPSRVSEDHDDDVSKQYIRGSRSPPGIANHLLRSAKTDKTKEPVKTSVDVNNVVEKQAPVSETSSSSKASIGHSAKKRWLMAAMSVDMTENDEGSGASPAAPASPELPDYTPLKKRRLAEYTNDSSEDVIASIAGESAVSDKIKSLPNGLKKRLISNLVLEAVLDKAMEDYTPSNYNDEPLDSNNEDTSSPYINDMGEEEAEAIEPVPKPRSFRDKRKEAILQAEMDARSNNSSESEEASVNEARVQVRESFVPMKKCALPAEEGSETSSASPNPAPAPCVPEEEPVTNERPVSESRDLSEPIRGQEEEETNDVPDKAEREDAAVVMDEESACSTPLQDEDTADSVSASVSVPSQHTVFKSFFSTDLSVEDIDRQLEAKREALVKEAMTSGEASPMSLSDAGPPSSTQPQSSSASIMSEAASASVKKRMSLADYKKRKLSQVDSVGGSQPATPTATPLAPIGLASLPPLPLPSLPSLSLARDHHETDHKHDSRERSRHSSHRSSHSHSRPGSGPASRSPSSSRPTSESGNRIQAPETEPEPREDLTERLRKEFGLTIDEDEDEPDNDNNLDSLPSEARNTKVNNVAKEVSRERREPSRSDKTEHRSLSSSSSKPSEFSRSSNKYSSDGLSSRSRDGGYSDKGYSSKYHDKRSDYRDSRDASLSNERPGSRSRDLSGPISIGYRDKSRESRHHDKSRHGGRRPSHPSSPSSGPGGHRGMSLTNGGGGRRHHGSPSRRSSQDKESRYSSSHSSSGKIIRDKLHEDKYNSSDKYYKSEPSRRNFYPQ